MISHHVACHVTSVTCLFIIKEKKRDIKLRKIDKRKRKRKMLVLKHTITHDIEKNIEGSKTMIL